MRLLVMLGFLGSSVLLAQAGGNLSPAPQGQAASTASKEGATKVFRIDALHLAYTYPASYTDAGALGQAELDQQKTQADDETRKALSCIASPFVGTEIGEHLHILFLIRLDGTCMGHAFSAAELAPLVVSSLTQSLGKFGTPKMDATTPYELAGRPATAVSGGVDATQIGGIIHAAATCTTEGKDAVCWEFLSNECEGLPVMAAYPVSLDGKPGEPVLPARLLPRCSATTNGEK